MSAVVGTRTTTLVSTYARAITFVANELLRLALLITTNRGTGGGALVHRMTVVSNGLRVWILAQELASFHIEFLSRRGQVIERWDFPLVYEKEPTGEERLETNMEQIESAFTKLDSLPPSTYRLIATCKENRTPVEGWSPTTLGDVSHLTSRQVSERLIDTLSIGVKAFVFTKGASDGSSV